MIGFATAMQVAQNKCTSDRRIGNSLMHGENLRLMSYQQAQGSLQVFHVLLSVLYHTKEKLHRTIRRSGCARGTSLRESPSIRQRTWLRKQAKYIQIEHSPLVHQYGVLTCDQASAMLNEISQMHTKPFGTHPMNPV